MKNLLKKAQKSLLKAQEVLAQISFDYKDMELVKIDKKYEAIKKQG